MRCSRVALVLFLGVVMFWSGTATAEVTRFEIVERVPFAEGRSFGGVGPYEKLTGRVHFRLDPNQDSNRRVIDLDLAPRNERGFVECSADFVILSPKDPLQGNRCLLYDVNNRGNKTALGMFNGAGGNAADKPGDGFLFEQGFTVVWSGWDAELFPGDNRLRLHAPVAGHGENAPTGRVRCEFQPNRGSPKRLAVTFWANHGSYRPLAGNAARMELTVRANSRSARTPITSDQWKVHVTEVPDSQLPLIEVELLGNWQPGALYELSYEASGSLVHGCAFSSVRDLIAALKLGLGDGNPFHAGDASRPPFDRAIGFGISQSGRFLRDFVYSGFNAAETGEIVFNGIIPHVAGGGLGSFNHRFAQPTRHGQQHDHDDYPVDRFPFAYSETFDSLTGRTDSVLASAMVSRTVPKVMHTQSAGEYWTRSGSLVHTDPLGQRDLSLPDHVRIYAFGGTQHGPAGFPPGQSGVYPANPGDFKPFVRALLLALDRWIASNEAPPESVFPRIARGELVPLEAWRRAFPAVSMKAQLPAILRSPPAADYGPNWHSRGWIELQPPRVMGRYVSLVPQAGPDGNDLGCLLPPEVAVPLATYTGWNIRTAEQGAAGELVSLTGSYIPFARSDAERQPGDQRASLAGRYGSVDAYIEQLTAECERLVTAKLLLPADAQRLIGVYSQRARTAFQPQP